MITDHLGSERSIYTSNGAIWDQTDYDPFGRPQSVGTPHNSYIDRERDGESSLFDFGVRKYDPVTGRFLSFDALGLLTPRQSPYSYAGNNPLVNLDPSGLEWIPIANPLNPGEYDWQEVSVTVRAAGFMGSGPQGFAGTINVGGGAGSPTASMPDVTQLPSLRNGSGGINPQPVKKPLDAEHYSGPLAGARGSASASSSRKSGRDKAKAAMAAGATAIGVVVADDATGVGVADDFLVPVIFVGSAAVAGYYLAEAAAEESGSISVDDLVEGSTPIPDSRMGPDEREREGGDEQRQKDFENLGGELIGASGIAKTLPDGRRAVLHPSSEREDYLSLTIQNAAGNKVLKKFRYKK